MTFDSRASRFRLVAAFAALGLFAAAPPAQATHVSNFAQYFDGWLAPGQGASTGHYYCDHLWRSEASWDAAGWHVTVAIIEPGGGWISSARSSSGAVFTEVSPETATANKAHCKNTEGIYSFSVRCYRAFAYVHGVCA
jgi:hypothetical protein